jgi:hypothetical protein
VVTAKVVAIWLPFRAYSRGSSGRAETQNASECLGMRPDAPVTFSIRAVTRPGPRRASRAQNPSIHRPKREDGGGSISESAAQVQVSSRLFDPERLVSPSAAAVQDGPTSVVMGSS